MTFRFFFSLYLIFFLNLSPTINSNVFSQDFKTKNWFSVLDNNSILIGSGKLYFFGIKLYKASFFSVPTINREFPFENKFALTIKYSKSVKKEKIADTSKKEMLRLNLYKEPKINNWHNWMLEKFPDISSGDILTGIFLPEVGIKLFHNDILIAENDSVDFAIAFFSIWLHKDTSRPKLRNNLFESRN